jgi:uncharacterized membrane protein
MATVVNTGLVLFLISFPFASQYARDRIRGFGFVNPLIAAYIIGIVLGNTLLRGERFLPLLDTIATAGVLVSIPLMLFNLNLRTVGKTAGKALLGITLAGVSILVTVVIAWGLFGSKIPGGSRDCWWRCIPGELPIWRQYAPPRVSITISIWPFMRATYS